MAEEAMTPDLVELTRQSADAMSRADLDALMSLLGPDPVFDLSPIGLGLYEGSAAIRGFAEDWLDSYELFEMEAGEVLDLGSGVTFAVVSQMGRVPGGSAEVKVLYASVCVWENGLIARATNYSDIDEARAAAERLAEQRR